MWRALPVLVALAASTALAAEAAPPIVLNHSGRLLSSNDTPVTTPVKLTVAIYKSLEGTDRVFTDTYPQLPVLNGTYSLVLGAPNDQGHPLLTADMFDGGERFLSVSVDDVELKPRLRIGTVPHAIYAETAKTAALALALDPAAKIDGATQVTGSVPHAKAAGALDAAATIDGASQVTGFVPKATLAATLDPAAKIDGATQVTGIVPKAQLALALDGAAKIDGATQVTGIVPKAAVAGALDGAATIQGSQIQGSVADAAKLNGVAASQYVRLGSNGTLGDVTAGNVVASGFHLPAVAPVTTGVYPAGPSFTANPFLRRNANRSIFDKGSLPWESNHVEEVFVLRDTNEYKMYYSAAGTTGFQLGVAHAPLNPSNGKPFWDPSNWTRDPANPVVRIGQQSWMGSGVYGPQVVKVNGTYYMYFVSSQGGHYRIGMATSNDGVAWTLNQNNPIVSTITGDSNHQFYPSVIVEPNPGGGNTFKMWYSGHDGSWWRTFYLTSTDGISWTRPNVNPGDSGGYTNVVMDISQETYITNTAGEYHMHVEAPSVVKVGDTYWMECARAGTKWTTWLYASKDGIAWTRVKQLMNSDGNSTGWSFDGNQVSEQGSFLVDGNTVYLFYPGYNGSYWSIGLATMDF